MENRNKTNHSDISPGISQWMVERSNGAQFPSFTWCVASLNGRTRPANVIVLLVDHDRATQHCTSSKERQSGVIECCVQTHQSVQHSKLAAQVSHLILIWCSHSRWGGQTCAHIVRIPVVVQRRAFTRELLITLNWSLQHHIMCITITSCIFLFHIIFIYNTVKPAFSGISRDCKLFPL